MSGAAGAAPPPAAGDPAWETVVGLEVHVELATATKLFSAAPARFGDTPNTNITPVCLGLPGSLPVLNRRAVELAITVGLALECEIAPSVFHRKNYFYPDMVKDYQISQYDEPICRNGRLELASGAVIGIERAHLEEDAGKTTHLGGADGRIHGAAGALLDYNRAGIALLEIVSRPDLRSAAAARSYVEELRAILRATGASDARLEHGSMRVDVNVSVRPAGSDELRTRCEVKNVNSLRALVRAVEYEAQRHIELYAAGDSPSRQTRHVGEDGRTHTLRSKEGDDDYRYFPEPDL
ncbi:MAG TPA: Asp-tRNA(Asn)/Glu-tRNA(Gln) amidotransferase subunit GatB, partial [Acidimicrobiaceae bacterium]|nr:Asp-tRNA(Asn)/Glu-tRNA(Gln) amidotransferase subunit GatB [Acidimicrobiaceae bacterium]